MIEVVVCSLIQRNTRAHKHIRLHGRHTSTSETRICPVNPWFKFHVTPGLPIGLLEWEARKATVDECNRKEVGRH